MEMNKFMIKKEKIMAATVSPMMAINILSTLKVEATHLWVHIIIIRMRPRIMNKIKFMMLKTIKTMEKRMMMMMKKRKKRKKRKVKKSCKKSNMLMRLSKPIKRSESRKSRSIRAQSRNGQNSYLIPQKYLARGRGWQEYTLNWREISQKFLKF